MKKRFISMLVLLMTVATGAWANPNSIVINGTPQVGDKSISLTYHFDPANVSGINNSYAPTLKVKCAADNKWDEMWLNFSGVSSGTTNISLENLGEFEAGKTYEVCFAYNNGNWVDDVFQSFVPAAPATTYSITVKKGTEDASNWQGKAGEGEYQALPLEGVAANTAVSVKYNGTKKVKSVKAVKVAPAVTNLSTINADYTANDGETLTGTLGADVKISIADGATVTLDDVIINGTHNYSYTWAGITCLGDATIILKDESVNSVVGFCYSYPGIYIPHGKTLTIQGETLGTGVLNATGAGYSAGIGAARESVDIYRSCGNIVIAGGVINATAGGERAAGIGCGGTTNPGTANPSTCGTITITGGTITATGGKWAPGIGSGFYATCGDITIANTVTRVTATKGDRSSYVATSFDCIGRGREGACGTVKFGNQTMYNGSSWTTTPTSGSTYGGLNLTISQTTYADDTWTLTPAP